VILVVSGCATLRKAGVPYPTARVLGVDLAGVSLTSLTLQFDVEVKNPYATPLPILGIDYAISTEGKRFLEGGIESSQTIPSKESGVVPLAVKIPFLTLRDVVGDVRPGMTIPYRADFDLKVDAPVVGSIRLPVDTKGSVSIPSLP
jgi:LEA14-like dessication related protein